MSSSSINGWTPFLLFLKAELDYLHLASENTATDAVEDLENSILIICEIREAAKKWEDIPEDLKLYFSKRATSLNKGSHIPNPNKKIQNDIIRELGGQTGFYSVLLNNRARWYANSNPRKSIGIQVIEIYLFHWNELTKKARKRHNQLWKSENPD